MNSQSPVRAPALPTRPATLACSLGLVWPQPANRGTRGVDPGACSHTVCLGVCAKQLYFNLLGSPVRSGLQECHCEKKVLKTIDWMSSKVPFGFKVGGV